MATEKFNNINNQESNASAETSSWIKNTKLALTALAISLWVHTATWQDTSSQDSIKHQTEITAQGEDPTKAILDKHKITDIKSATLEQLEWAYKELWEVLQTLTDKEAKRPYLILKSNINSQITLLKSIQRMEAAKIAADKATVDADKATADANKATADANKAIAQAKASTEIVQSLKWKKE
jgi:hypothetical protein